MIERITEKEFLEIEKESKNKKTCRNCLHSENGDGLLFCKHRKNSLYYIGRNGKAFKKFPVCKFVNNGDVCSEYANGYFWKNFNITTIIIAIIAISISILRVLVIVFKFILNGF